MTGFWGEPTSSVDWCEQNYVVTPYVAEFFNTASSLAMVLAGAVGIALHHGLIGWRFVFAFALLMLVGAGSVAFHGALRFELQMMDELPMLYLVILMVYVLVETDPAPRFGPWFPGLLCAHAVLVTALSAFTRGTLQFYAFQLSFGSLELFAIYKVFVLFRRSGDPVARRLFRFGIAAYALAVTVWFVDLKFCALLTGERNPQLHAGWHVLVSFGFYSLLLFIADERRRRLGLPSRLELRGPFGRLRAQPSP